MKTTLALILLALIAASALLGFPWMNQRFELADLRTSAQQELSRPLNDGSLLVLQASTAVDVEYDAQQRRVTLLEGGLWVEVAKGDPRPFLLVTEHGTLATHDARLSLVRLAGQTQARLLSGNAELDSAGQRVHVQGGQAIRFGAGGPLGP
ncbi:FecR domain-containing protein [Pseudomonas sp. GD03858]|uniref:FecR domain-containing protein n=1 Tax=unclassified Pseudomonas TaxID=196821 RepID=UPI00244A59A5|nr:MULTISPECIES: FecR domain-containing protein [unclassified Pseudomonas]MDH0646129.1 FecR domain-containing protein [Pseudomonas sp. GD03867]MDH0661410.1 FecR domain-containing protein [Pseudomonas sp. GD03858]